MRKLKRIAVLISGGLDSAILLGFLLKRNYDIYPIYIKSGNFWETIEFFWLRRFLQSLPQSQLHRLTVLELPTRDLNQKFWAISGKKIPGAKSRDEAVYLPGRNILLIAKTAIFCMEHGIPKIALASLKTNPFPDAQPSFFKKYSALLSTALACPIQIIAPFSRLAKKEVMRLGRQVSLNLTFSCINPKGMRHCGHCNKCAERKKAFRSAGIADPTHYYR